GGCAGRGRARRPRPPRRARWRLPADGALLGDVHLLRLPGVEEEALQVLRQELLRVGIPNVQAVMVDQHRLVPEPLAPAHLADLGLDAAPQVGVQRCVREGGPGLAAAGALDIRHAYVSLLLVARDRVPPPARRCRPSYPSGPRPATDRKFESRYGTRARGGW